MDNQKLTLNPAAPTPPAATPTPADPMAALTGTPVAPVPAAVPTTTPVAATPAPAVQPFPPMPAANQTTPAPTIAPIAAPTVTPAPPAVASAQVVAPVTTPTPATPPAAAPADSTEGKGAGKYLVRVINNKCIGAASCVAVAPKAFKLNDKQIAEVLATVAEDTDDNLLLAAQSCPTLAIEVIDTETGAKVWPK